MFYLATDITISLGDIVAAATAFVIVIAALVETRVRVHLMGRDMRAVTEFQKTCNTDRTKQYEEIKDILGKIRTALGMTKVRVQMLAERNGIHVPDAVVEEDDDSC